ncbi:anillin-like isoform X2 [Photinus pyralis]|nr:anillin-like isoform X2 [Photinus pyralis]
MLLRMLYYLYYEKNQVLDEVSKFNFTNSIILEEKEIIQSDPHISLESSKITEDPIDTKVHNTHESSFKVRQLRRKDIRDYPESIRYKIQFFESMSSKQMSTDKSWSTNVGKLRTNTSVEVVARPPPVVVGMVLKQNSCEIDNCDTYSFDKRKSFQQSSVMSSKSKGNERFLVNILEPRTTKNPKKSTDINRSIITMDSQLYIKPHEDNATDEERDSVSESVRNLNEAIRELVHKAYDQSQILKQAAKAVDVCRRSKVFYNSIQRAEAERILLTASLKRAHYLHRIEKEELQYPSDSKNTADLTISNIKFPFNVEEIDSKRRYWYLVTCVTDRRFHVSSMLELNLKRSYLQLPEMYSFQGVSPDFKIKLHVYELNSDNADRRKPRRLHQKLKQKILHGAHFEATLEGKIRPAFKKCGWLELTINNLSQNVLTLNKKGDGTPLSVVHLSASAFSQALNLKHSGFLTIGAESNGHLVWDKNWCRLLNSVLHFWSNPSEESLNGYKLFIDLRHCVIIDIHNVCLRPNTLALEHTSLEQASRYYLSCDTLEEIDEWKRCITSILDTFKGWKALMYV